MCPNLVYSLNMFNLFYIDNVASLSQVAILI